MEFVADLETKPGCSKFWSEAANPMEDVASPISQVGWTPMRAPIRCSAGRRASSEYVQPTPSFFQSGSHWGEVCMASVQRPAWLLDENILPVFSQRHPFLPPSRPLILQRKDDKTYQLFHRLTVDGQNQTCGLGAKITFTRCLEIHNSGFQRGKALPNFFFELMVVV